MAKHFERKPRMRTGICERCTSWKVTAKGSYGATVDRSLVGYCRAHCLTTFSSGHCAAFSAVIKIQVKGVA